MSFKVTDFGTNQKAVRNFLLVILTYVLSRTVFELQRSRLQVKLSLNNGGASV